MPLPKKHTRRYRIRTPEMINWVVSCIKLAPHHVKLERLDDYELNAIRQPRSFAKFAPIEEIIVILTRLGYQTALIGFDAQGGMNPKEMAKGAIDWVRNGDTKQLTAYLAKHKFFSLAGKEILRTQALYSQIIHGNIFVINHDFKTFMKIGALRLKDAEQYANQRAVDEVIANTFLKNPVDDLTRIELAILFLLRKYDTLPLTLKNIKELLKHTQPIEFLFPIVSKLHQHGYLNKFGKGHKTSYMLSPKGWLAKEQARKEYFHGVRFSDLGIKMVVDEIKKQIKQENGTDGIEEAEGLPEDISAMQ